MRFDTFLYDLLRSGAIHSHDLSISGVTITQGHLVRMVKCCSLCNLEALRGMTKYVLKELA